MKINKERKSKRGKANKEKGVITDVMNRKQLRKMKRQSKKINKQAYYAKRVHNVSQISSTEQSKIQKQGLIERAEEK